MDKPNQPRTILNVGAPTSSNRSGAPTLEQTTRRLLSYDPRGWDTISGFKLDFFLDVLGWLVVENPGYRDATEAEIHRQYLGMVALRESRRRKPAENKVEKKGIQYLLFDLVQGQ